MGTYCMLLSMLRKLPGMDCREDQEAKRDRVLENRKVTRESHRRPNL
ncbi:hypothetical protein HanPSC8_Chr03g0133711 [Helianthus annuus]|nr:hypothetical protein HanPSC8_Chr03g0133711 [Helianthus annuus]